MTESTDPHAEDERRLSALRDHAGRANHAAVTGGAGRTGVRRAADRVGRATSPHQQEVNVETGAALVELPAIIERLNARLDALEANSTELWAATTTPVASTSTDNTALRAMFASHDVLLGELADSLDGLGSGFDDLLKRFDESESTAETAPERDRTAEAVERLERLVGSLRRDLEQVRGSVANGRAQVETLLHDFRAEPEIVTRTAAEAADVRVADIYSRFEERFRGSRDDVARSLDAYESDLDRLGAHGPVLDIGSGRGEFLERLGVDGIEAYGVDTNQTFVTACTARGLDVRLADAMDHLAAVPAGSLGAVTGFHIVEHLPVPTLIELLDRALLALAPGGRILFETPNPTNLIVGASSFYLDPTHLRPLHPDLLSFLVSDRGFVDVETRFLHPARTDLLDQIDELDDVERMARWSLFGPQDVAVLATAPGRVEA